MLNHALIQSGWESGVVTEKRWRGLMRERMRTLDWKSIQVEVQPFIEPGLYLGMLTQEHLEGVLAE